ncbi:MAG: acetate kinase, partial [Actinobacteria bacterium]|nr:acetate kinase [Actinomycetota bacterium]
MILSINPGSSSLKYKLFDDSVDELILGDDIVIDGTEIKSHTDASNKMLENIGSRINFIKMIGIRVVHGGPKYSEPIIIDPDVISEIEKYSQFAPIHNPFALEIIKLLDKKSLTGVLLFAVFDTGYFNLISEENHSYALPEIEGDIKIRRYGFHGISHRYAQKIADKENQKKVISIHLGAGCSVTAINCGKVVKTSMGMTPMEGLIMQTRSGDLDPGLLIYLVEKFGTK